MTQSDTILCPKGQLHCDNSGHYLTLKKINKGEMVTMFHTWADTELVTVILVSSP